MGSKLAGVAFIRLGVKLGYCFEASINSMKSVCDHVFITYIQCVEDNTYEVLKGMLDSKLTILSCTDEQWQAQKGKEKISFFQNLSIEYAQREGYEYVLLVQCDEVLHEDSIPFIKRALALNEEAYYVSRYNMWGSKSTMLNVPQSRKPCSTCVNRMAKSYYRSVDDGENLATNNASLDFINLIEIFHVGFIRDSKKHIEKVKEIQGNIFLMDVDSRVKDAETFDAWAMGFEKTDVIPIHKPLPKFLDEWIKDK